MSDEVGRLHENYILWNTKCFVEFVKIHFFAIKIKCVCPAHTQLNLSVCCRHKLSNYIKIH